VHGSREVRDLGKYSPELDLHLIFSQDLYSSDQIIDLAIHDKNDIPQTDMVTKARENKQDRLLAETRAATPS